MLLFREVSSSRRLLYSVQRSSSAHIFLQLLSLIVCWRGMILGWGGDAGGSKGDLLCVEVPVVVELSSMGGSEFSESDSESDSLVELAGGMVS